VLLIIGSEKSWFSDIVYPSVDELIGFLNHTLSGAENQSIWIGSPAGDPKITLTNGVVCL
jgi:hypothetical protein